VSLNSKTTQGLKMKIILFIIMLLMSIPSWAEPLRLQIVPNGDQQVVSFIENEWYFVAKEANYTVYLAKGEIEESNGYLMIQSHTTYNTFETYSYMEKPVKRVFTYGAMDCDNKRLYLLGSLYSAEDNTVQYTQYYEMGEWVSDLNKEGTARNEVYKAICNKSV
jgi:hypothetical protein